MEYEATAAKLRLTGRGYFTADGDTSAIDLGNIQMIALDFGIKRKEHYKARRGSLVADRFDAYSAIPKFEITGDEFTTAMLFIIFLGTDAGNSTQLSATGSTFMCTSKKGKVFDIGKFGLTNASLTTPASKIEGYTADYVIDRGPGKLYIPNSSTIADSTACTVTYDCPTFVFNNILPPLSTLNRSGTMQLIEEDEFRAMPRNVHDFECILSADGLGDTKPDDYKTFKLTAIVSDPSTWLLRSRSA
jgi:hypothetical protein